MSQVIARVIIILTVLTIKCCLADENNEKLPTITTTNSPFGTTGTPCFSNLTCTGPNEYCKFLTDFDAPCQQGLCECVPCYALDRNGICSPINKLQLGDACFGERNEAIIVEGAACYLGVVSCKSGFTQSSNYCGDDGGYPFNAQCDSSYYCAGDMKCLNRTCSCIGGGQYKFDPHLNACVFKQLGDQCDHDDDCQIGGTMWIGFTADQAVCLDKKCACGPTSREVTIAQFDPGTGNVKMKRICIHSNGTVGLIYGSTCDLDPVIGGNVADVQVCDEPFVCIRCPEDQVEDHKGRCRSPITPLPPPPVCYQPITQPATSNEEFIVGVGAADPPADFSAGADQEQVVITLTSAVSLSSASNEDPNPDTWSWSDRLMAAVANRTWYNNGWPYRQCASAIQCYTNEKCLVPNFCQRGVCACIPPNYQDNHENCLSPPSSSLPSTTMTPPPTTVSMVVVDENGTSINLSNKTIESESLASSDASQNVSGSQSYYYGMECQSVTDCARIGLNSQAATVLNGLVKNGLHCMSNVTSEDGDNSDSTIGGRQFCLCPSAKYKWNQTSFRCQENEFGDSCLSDSDCDTGVYTKLSTGGFKCLTETGTCGCNLPAFTQVTVAVLSAAWGAVMPRNLPLAITRKTYCVASAGHKPGIFAGGNCTINVVENSDSTTYTCASGLVCLSCPADATYGMCTSLTTIFGEAPTLNVELMAKSGSDAILIPRVQPVLLLLLSFFTIIEPLLIN